MKQTLSAAAFDALCRPQHMDDLRQTGVDVELFREVYMKLYDAYLCPFQAQARTLRFFFIRGSDDRLN